MMLQLPYISATGAKACNVSTITAKPTPRRQYKGPQHSPQTFRDPQNNAHASFTLFGLLPTEIQDQIWAHTLVPRLIYIHPHQRLSPPWYDPSGKSTYDGFRPTVSTRFNHSLYSDSILPCEAFARYADFAAPNPTSIWEGNPSELEYAHFMATRPFEYKSADPPAALYICKQSREVAMRMGYVLAFKGVLQHLDHLLPEDLKYWEDNHMGDKGVWVDFDRDIIMLDATFRLWMYSKCAPLQPLVLLNKTCPLDVRRIKRLALGGYTGTILKSLMGTMVKNSTEPTWKRPYQWFVGLGFESLTELLLDDEFKTDLPRGISAGNSPVTAEDALIFFAEKLKEAKNETPHWKSELPVVKVVRGESWRNYLGST